MSNTVADTSPPKVAISAPAAGATSSGSVTVSGTAADDIALAKVEFSVDGGAYQLASGTGSWSFGLATTALAGNSHTLSARATDTSGNTQTANETIAVSNITTPTSPTPTVIDQWVAHGGVTINVYPDVVGWTAQKVYDVLKPNAYQLDVLGPTPTINVLTPNASQTQSSASADASGVCGHFRTTITLQATTK